MQCIRDCSDLAAATKALVAQDRRFGAVAAAAAPVPLRLSEPGFKSLIAIMVSQRISQAASHTIFARLGSIVFPFDARTWLATNDKELKSAGLSAPKLRHARAIAERVRDGSLALAGLHELDDGEARANLMQTPGIGRWTADIYLLTCLGRSDVWPTGDLALRVATSHFLRRRKLLSPGEMQIVSRDWSPWRSVASRLLWAHYRRLKIKEAV